jgi:hypothetical protein
MAESYAVRLACAMVCPDAGEVALSQADRSRKKMTVASSVPVELKAN